MKGFKDRVFQPNCSHNDCDIDDYFTRDESFGRFTENGRAYVIERRDTPREWVQYLCNDKVRSAISNTGKGFLFHATGPNVTKQYEANGNYLPRNVNGERKLYIEVKDCGDVCEFFSESTNFLCTVRPGYMVYEGDVAKLHIEVTVFVPQDAPCECWNVKITNAGAMSQKVVLSARQDVDCRVDTEGYQYTYNDAKTAIYTLVDKLTNIFTASEVEDVLAEPYSESGLRGEHLVYVRDTIKGSVVIAENESVTWNVLSSACENAEEEDRVLAYLDAEMCAQELEKITTMWDGIISRNYCELPDKNMEYFMNVWLKNQVYLTYRYDRNAHFIGYRDGLQDSWGNLLVEPEKAKEKFTLCLSYMMADGRCPRQFDRFSDEHDMNDFSDSPTWAPITLNSYIKETGDYEILWKELPFLNSEETSSVEDHIYRALDYMYHSRGKNGLILVRDGDWADGLSGINQYGADATSVWVTIAAYNAQNLMAEIYREVGLIEKAVEMEQRSAEYKKIVNEVGWDGRWLVYGFFEDGEPIGSSKNYEGKIWLNPQTWGIFTGIIDDENKINRITHAISRYLDTPYGAMVMYPPYVFHGERCGRIQKQRPGMFLNGSIYNHAASFKVFSDIKRGDFDEAYDTLMRCLPNHPDNSDTRRTSEPFSVGNVYYGPNHSRYGMNLFSWFTAAPSWLIHGGFEEILGVKAGFHGLELTPRVPADWSEYKVSKLYRGTMYQIQFIRSNEETGVWVDGQKQDGNVINSDKKVCDVLVKY